MLTITLACVSLQAGIAQGPAVEPRTIQVVDARLDEVGPDPSADRWVDPLEALAAEIADPGSRPSVAPPRPATALLYVGLKDLPFKGDRGVARLLEAGSGWRIEVASDVEDFLVDATWSSSWYGLLGAVAESAGLCLYTDTRAHVIEVEHCG